jgi:hypothetical protein
VTSLHVRRLWGLAAEGVARSERLAPFRPRTLSGRTREAR